MLEFLAKILGCLSAFNDKSNNLILPLILIFRVSYLRKYTMMFFLCLFIYCVYIHFVSVLFTFFVAVVVVSSFSCCFIIVAVVVKVNVCIGNSLEIYEISLILIFLREFVLQSTAHLCLLCYSLL